jgi:hypothetical protein
VRSPAIALGTENGRVVVSSFAVDFCVRTTVGTLVRSAESGAYEGQLLDYAAGTATLYGSIGERNREIVMAAMVNNMVRRSPSGS